MNVVLIVGGLAVFLTGLFFWAFRHLPAEQWQILAAVPLRREPDGHWHGVNLTYYGFFNALAAAIGVAIVLFLAGAAAVPIRDAALGVVLFLAVVLPASRVVNRIVEGHWHGFTVGGAAFVGLTVGPWLIAGLLLRRRPYIEAAAMTAYMLGAVASAYAVGEGVGRLACISFGCCYGRPLDACPLWLRRLFGRAAVVFEGKLKKAAYAHGLDGRPLLPVQALTAVISSAAGLIGMTLFFFRHPMAAFLFSVAITQLWRFVSEFLRADYRGAGRISAYQWMALAGAVYAVLLTWLWPATGSAPDVVRGLNALWNPGALLLTLAVASVVFVRMGVSTVTTSRIGFGLHPQHAAAQKLPVE